eukprot:Gregarina_sp_Pseudo_9__266@NODE_116_length_4176_cov_4_195794_g108_i0_p5_GENE_NODE_116_length_4176_cov_4_195794_g108_i0NODE_116_length_4176_cov_4_195794_g108_i0_p5_ORF_typecomplete_len108_score1_45_NODE_116_length_4176_cov_4_195794_g108_i0428751
MSGGRKQQAFGLAAKFFHCLCPVYIRVFCFPTFSPARREWSFLRQVFPSCVAAAGSPGRTVRRGVIALTNRPTNKLTDRESDGWTSVQSESTGERMQSYTQERRESL